MCMHSKTQSAKARCLFVSQKLARLESQEVYVSISSVRISCTKLTPYLPFLNLALPAIVKRSSGI